MRVPTNDSERKVVSDVQEFGWHVVLVSDDEVGPGFAFTVGLYHNYQHPEVVVFGLPQKVSHRVLNLIGGAVKEGQQFRAGTRSSEILEMHECAFLAFPIRAYRDYLGYARWFYSGDEFPALQCVWPDGQGVFPWEPGASAHSKSLQPMPCFDGEGAPI